MYGTYLRLNLHVADSDVAVVRAARRKFQPQARKGPWLRDERHRFYRIMLRHHKEARDLFREVMYGELSGD